MKLRDDEIVVVSAVRTPFGRFGGSLKDIDCYDLSAIVMKEVLARVKLPGDVVDEIFWGVGDTTCCKDPYTPVVARQALLKAGLPPEIPSCSLDKACVSAMSAVNYGCRTIRAGEGEVILAGGVTSFSTVPFLLRNQRFHSKKMGHLTIEDPLLELGYKDYAPVAKDAGEVALMHGIDRFQQDEWAVSSHVKYGHAYAAGKFLDEMMALEVPQKNGVSVLNIDEQYRPDTTMEKLAALKPIYGSPTCTAGNAPGLNDGSAALLLTTRKKARELDLEPLGAIVGMVSIATKPRLLSEAPAIAIQKLLQKTGYGLEDINLFEINEAFAAVTLTSTKMLANGDMKKYEELKKKVNVNGGAIAIGHPNTASGARLIGTLIYELRRRGGGLGVAAICGGLAQGDAALVRV
ncbi:acetyl-CoA acetyltransferase [Desulfofundulus kuznetsovii DSM 6115]|uniref:acetyl-CoA C-acetyltransferase n=1 Tax=Desulfofundulus kuznetsovii (strain DSM 6115 / VKM B-1805 / 17) TaxID=760568 RepID=A0AAU8PE14_DESK7|nr:acetyl-CoA acetyltransferase [Desulfofundulus kuznetsovii DSM 6115]